MDLPRASHKPPRPPLLKWVLFLSCPKITTVSNMGNKMGRKIAAFKDAFRSRRAMVQYLEAPLLDGDEANLENRRVGLVNWARLKIL